MMRDGLLQDFGKAEYLACELYLSGKMVKKPFSKGIRSTRTLKAIHSDICGSLSVQTWTWGVAQRMNHAWLGP